MKMNKLKREQNIEIMVYAKAAVLLQVGPLGGKGNNAKNKMDIKHHYEEIVPK